jgi:hypothetical protein
VRVRQVVQHHGGRHVSLSALQRASLVRCIHAARAGMWHRAIGSGERVTLASLWRRGLIERRAWRGVEGQADAAHEYRASAAVREEVTRIVGVT